MVDDMDSLHVRGTLQSAPMDARRNVELKARDPDPDATLSAAIAHGATGGGTLHQRDVYFGARLELDVAPGLLHLADDRVPVQCRASTSSTTRCSQRR